MIIDDASISSLFETIIFPAVSIGIGAYLKIISMQTKKYKSMAEELISTQKELEEVRAKDLNKRFDDINARLTNTEKDIKEIISNLSDNTHTNLINSGQLELLAQFSAIHYDNCSSLNNYVIKLNSFISTMLLGSVPQDVKDDFKSDAKEFDAIVTSNRNKYFKIIQGGKPQ